MLRAIIPVASVAVTIFALADCVQTKDDRVRGIPKWAWIVLVVLIPWVGPITWLVVGKDRSQGDGGQPGRAPRRQGPLAPDEDPEFLRKLDEDIRRERRSRERELRERQAGQESPVELPDDDDPEPGSPPERKPDDES
ncbi:MAG TPA: PLD nuclease N-terminal domain-containing protein [Candidatus Brachybacterium merdavium]|uniref:PLD nuclease N-terminal domain-containing protein n=1 Tax=Candidatus Brachybacterium merdavium TaxID=2838513 RepID=A0A9D2LCB4_9MICO|nr:PLD nuclease N-terminal domain-containing protein [Candidatus Brachybacterium merdavium]